MSSIRVVCSDKNNTNNKSSLVIMMFVVLLFMFFSYQDVAFRNQKDNNSNTNIGRLGGGGVFVVAIDTADTDHADTADSTSDAATASTTTTTTTTSSNGRQQRQTQQAFQQSSSSSQPQPRIINGTPSDTSTTTFFIRTDRDELFFTPDTLCGATLIHRDILITAAHCFGAFNYGAIAYNPTSQAFNRRIVIDRQIRHPTWDFNKGQLNYDIALMRIQTPFAPNDAIQPIPINTDPTIPTDGQTLLAYGFGITELQQPSSTLLDAPVKALSNEECFGRGFDFGNVAMTEDVLCGDPIDGSSVCSGDSGGPLTDVDKTMLVGVTSFGSGCVADIVPDGYVRMSSVAPWIQETICLLSRVPPDDCPSRPPRDPSAVNMAMLFQHDFWAEETTWIIRSLPSREVVYSGPTYVPNRSDSWREEFTLLPGLYRIEIYDSEGNGLQVGEQLSSRFDDGQWELVAVYDGVTDTPVANGGPIFTNTQVVDFTVEDSTLTTPSIDPALTQCLELAQEEGVLGLAYETICDCISNAATSFQLSCQDRTGPCAASYASCNIDSDCCSGRRCRNGACRGVSSREDKIGSRLGSASGVGGAASRNNRGSGGVRRVESVDVIDVRQYNQNRVLRGS